MPKKLDKVKVKVHRLGKDGAYLSMSAGDPELGSFDLDLKYKDLCCEEMTDHILDIGHDLSKDVEEISYESRADVARYVEKCAWAIQRVTECFMCHAGLITKEECCDSPGNGANNPMQQPE
jgi:hypothetical protein